MATPGIPVEASHGWCEQCNELQLGLDDYLCTVCQQPGVLHEGNLQGTCFRHGWWGSQSVQIRQAWSCSRCCGPDGSFTPLPDVFKFGTEEQCAICLEGGESIVDEKLVVTFTPCGCKYCVDCFRRYATHLTQNHGTMSRAFIKASPDGFLLPSCSSHPESTLISHATLMLAGRPIYDQLCELATSRSFHQGQWLRCPAPTCGCAFEASHMWGKQIECPKCSMAMCVECGEEWGSCPHAPPKLKAISLPQTADELRKCIHETLCRALAQQCPGCGQKTERTEACTRMMCPRCWTVFCIVCGLEYCTCEDALFLHERASVKRALADQGKPFSDASATRLFTEYRCIYFLSNLKRATDEALWNSFQDENPGLLSSVVAGDGDIDWNALGNYEELGAVFRCMATPTTPGFEVPPHAGRRGPLRAVVYFTCFALTGSSIALFPWSYGYMICTYGYCAMLGLFLLAYWA